MDALGAYGFRIILAALVCGVLSSLVKDDSHAAILRTLCGTFLIITLLVPLTDITWNMDTSWISNAISAADLYSQDGEVMAKNETKRIVSDRLQTYLQEEAARLGAQLEITVMVGEDWVPAWVELRGPVSDSVKAELSEIMEKELSVTEENQIWTG